MTGSCKSVTLVFPAVDQRALDFLAQATARGECVVAAASELDGEIQRSIDNIRWIPRIYDADFEQKLFTLLEVEGVTQIFCPISTVFSFLTSLLLRKQSSIRLIGDSPIKLQMAQHASLMRRAESLTGLVDAISGCKTDVNSVEIASILKYTNLIYGESSETKLAAMIAVCGIAPKGDIVEIGSLMGRSAFLLMYLSARFKIGNVLTVDPWSASECVQKDSPLELQDVVDAWDYEVLAQGFAVATAILNFRHSHVHLRMPSAHGYAHYCTQSYPEGLFFDSAGGIAVIHIDGNHDYEAVKTDCLLWLQHLRPGAWLILDDYLWAHGDGPYRIGNQLLESEGDKIERAFVCGKALFIQWR